MMYTTRQAAKYLGISFYYLRNMRRFELNHEGPIGFQVKTRYGLNYQYTKEALDAWAAKHNWR